MPEAASMHVSGQVGSWRFLVDLTSDSSRIGSYWSSVRHLRLGRRIWQPTAEITGPVLSCPSTVFLGRDSLGQISIQQSLLQGPGEGYRVRRKVIRVKSQCST